jgi:peptidoglycan/LPS O-acetylase OafA/YrhL
LDGVRALAVTAVVIYHFGGGAPSWLPGGFLGVDVFFVLSGYLITGLLIDEHDRTGRIDLLAFWVRRLRRLMPALVLVLLAVTAWVWWATPPDAYPKRRADIFWTLADLANWHLIATSDTYFAAYTTASPLRHAWSLAVEEQFYLLWPAIVVAFFWIGRAGLDRFAVTGRAGLLGRVTQRPRLLILGFAAIGIAFSAYWMADTYTPIAPSHAYYATQGRLQELFIGCLLAVLLPRLTNRAGRWVGGTAGVAALAVLIAFALVREESAGYFRGGALAVCLAVAALIAGIELQPAGRLARICSWRPAVGLGRISYGVYLWHWPLVVAIDINEGMTTRQQVVRQALRVGITLAAAIGSYFLLERPVLGSRRVLHGPRRVILAAVAGVAFVVAVAIPATALPGTLAQQLQQSSDTACPGERIDRLVACTWPLGADTSQRPVALAVLGDSTARGLGPGLNDWADSTHSSWLEAAWKGCSSTGVMGLPGPGRAPDAPAQTCTDQAPVLIQQALATYRPPVVLIAEFSVHRLPLLVNGKELPAGTPEHSAALRTAYTAVVDEVAAYGGRVVFVELPPPGERFGEVVASGRPAARAKPLAAGGGPDMEAFNAVLRSVAVARPGTASTVSVTDLLCPDGRCAPVQDGMLRRTDGVHYTVRFSHYLVPILMRRIGVSATGVTN